MPVGHPWTTRSCCIFAPLLGQIHPTMPRSSRVLLRFEIFCLVQATPVELAGGIHNGFRNTEHPHAGLLLEMRMEQGGMSKSRRSEQLWSEKKLEHLVASRGSLTRFKVSEALDLCFCRVRHSFTTFAHRSAQSIPEPSPSYNTYDLWKVLKDLQRAENGIRCRVVMSTDVHCLHTGHWLCTDYARLCLSLQLRTALGQTEEIVTDSHCRACCGFYTSLRLQKL